LRSTEPANRVSGKSALIITVCFISSSTVLIRPRYPPGAARQRSRTESQVHRPNWWRVSKGTHLSRDRWSLSYRPRFWRLVGWLPPESLIGSFVAMCHFHNRYRRVVSNTRPKSDGCLLAIALQVCRKYLWSHRRPNFRQRLRKTHVDSLSSHRGEEQ